MQPMALIFSVWITTTSAAGEPPRVPATPPPTMAMAQLEDREITITEFYVKYETVSINRIVEEDGARRAVTDTQRVLTTRAKARRVGLELVRGFEANGKPLDSETLAQRLQAQTAVLILSHAQKIDPLFLPLLNPQGLVLVVPPEIPDQRDGNPRPG